MRIPLPDNAWADLRDPRKVPERLRRPLAAKSIGLGILVDLEALKKAETDEAAAKLLGEDGLLCSNEVNDLAVVALVAAWSFEQPITLDAVLDMPGEVYDALRAGVAPLVPLMHVSNEPSPDPASPTAPSQP